MRTVSVNFLAFGRKFSDRIVKYTFYVSIRMSRGFFRSFKNNFGPRAEDSTFRRCFSAGLSKQQSTYPEEQFNGKQLFEKRILFWWFSDNERKFSDRLAIFFAWVVKIACYVSVGMFRGDKTLEKNFFVKFGFWTKILWLLSKFLQGRCKNCLLRVHRKNLKEKRFRRKKIDIYQTLTNSEHFWPLAGNFPSGFSKLHYTCSLKQFQKKSFWKKFHSFIILGNWLNFSCRFGIFSWLNYENCIVRVCRKSLRKFFFELDKVFHQMRTVSVKKSVFARIFFRQDCQVCI